MFTFCYFSRAPHPFCGSIHSLFSNYRALVNTFFLSREEANSSTVFFNSSNNFGGCLERVLRTSVPHPTNGLGGDNSGLLDGHEWVIYGDLSIHLQTWTGAILLAASLPSKFLTYFFNPDRSFTR